MYERHWRTFSSWCSENDLQALPASPETVSLYVANLARTLAVATINTVVAAISQVHQAAGFDSPTWSADTRAVWRGVRREKGVAPKQVVPVLTETLRGMVSTVPDNLLGKRDRALLILGYAMASRRSELVSLDVEDITRVEDGLEVRIKRSKTDQEQAGRIVGVPYGSNPDTCPVRSLSRWLDASGIESGAIFRPIDRHGRLGSERLSPAAVADVVKRTAKRIGKDERNYAGHSLRSGFCTQAASSSSMHSIMLQSGHRSESQVRSYIRKGSLFVDNAASRLGL